MSTVSLMGHVARYRHEIWATTAGGILALAASVSVTPTYTTSTLLLLRARDSTVLTSTGESLAAQPAVVDSLLVRSLSETHRALVASPAVAAAVIDRLGPEGAGLDRSGGHGPLARARSWLAGAGPDPGDRARAIQHVRDALRATPLRDSYALEVFGSGPTGEVAAAVTDAAADALIALGRARASEEAAANRDHLARQLSRAGTDLGAAVDTRRALGDAAGAGETAVADQRVDAARQAYQDLSSRHRAAALAAERAPVEITRVDRAPVPAVPLRPRRPVALGLGLAAGAGAGSALGSRRRRTRSRPAPRAGAGEAPGACGDRPVSARPVVTTVRPHAIYVSVPGGGA